MLLLPPTPPTPSMPHPPYFGCALRLRSGQAQYKCPMPKLQIFLKNLGDWYT
ncbi:hypothetical protein H6G98_05075 [Nostoc sp. FACHB-857]|nr:hypothetical protein [Nostoc sp. FACHB-857]